MWRKLHKLGIPSSHTCTVSSSRVSSDTMLVFQHISYHYDLRIFNWKNNMHSNKTQAQQSNTRDNECNVFPQGNHKWRKPCNFLRDRINTKSKTWKHKDDLPTAIVSLSNPSFFSLTHVPQWVSVCVINREAHSLFIFFRSLNVHFNHYIIWGQNPTATMSEIRH